MMNSWWTDEKLMMSWWWADDEQMISWWADNELMMSWWWADDEQIMSWWWADHYKTPLNTQSYKWRDGWMGWLSLGCATYRASLGANKLSVYNSESLCKMFVRKEEILAMKIPAFWFHSLMPVAWNKNQERESSRINISSFMNWHSLLLLVWIRFRQTLLG